VNAYRRRVLELTGQLLRPLAPLERALDFGAGDGWFARELKREKLCAEIVPVDVQARPRTFTPVRLYDGQRLPFADREFELAYAMDVTHHCPDPRAALIELGRCAGRYLLLKDHTFAGPLGWLALATLDELGNRRFGIPSRYRYQRKWQWMPLLKEQGWTVERLIHPARCHGGPLGLATNRLQFLALFRRA
jgi:SAM-dependent methyltransferase